MTGLLTVCDALPLGRTSVFVLVIQQDTNEAAMSVVNGHFQDDFDLSFKVFHELMKKSLKIILIMVLVLIPCKLQAFERYNRVVKKVPASSPAGIYLQVSTMTG